MSEPALFGVPISMAFLFFVAYAFLGWCMETIYCSIQQKRFVSRGFLHGPLCPIYGVGVLMMICWFQPLMDRPLLFYITATVCMSAWEYLVGWFLETTTHIKYWDYSMFRFNLHGRICLWVCLTWGVLSFVVLYAIQPRVESLLAQIPQVARYVLDGFFLGALFYDTLATVIELVRTSRLLVRLRQAGEELRGQAAMSREGFSEMLAGARERLDDLLPEQLDDAGKALKARYDDMVTRAEILTRRLRDAYRDMSSAGPEKEALESIKRRGERLKSLRLNTKCKRKK